MKTIMINVTEEHIKSGLRKSCKKCPLALALRDLGLDATVVFSTVVIKRNRQRIASGSHVTTKAMQEFILRFDNAVTVKPRRFRWNVRSVGEK
jgi:hypothetical protein